MKEEQRTQYIRHGRAAVLCLVVMVMSCRDVRFAASTLTVNEGDHFSRYVAEYSFPENRDCTRENQNNYVYDLMTRTYLFEDLMPEIDNFEGYTPVSLLEALKVNPPDRSSFIINEQFVSGFLNEGKVQGFGFYYQLGDDSFVLTHVFRNSSAGMNGLERGDRITAINGARIADMGKWPADTRIRKAGTGSNLTFTVAKVGTAGQEMDYTLSKGWFAKNTVIAQSVVEHGSKRVGYLGLTDFLATSSVEIQEAFELFGEENINELVVDLRYNPGGYITVANELASLIAQEKGRGKFTARLTFNSQNSRYNYAYAFTGDKTHDFSLERVYFLTLGNTCSASELIVNTLEPVGIDVFTIGGRTCGKPFGSISVNFCGYSAFHLIFWVDNHDFRGRYVNGIEPDFPASDDPWHGFADINEGMFAAALEHMDTGTFPREAATGRFGRPRGLSQREREFVTDPSKTVY